MDGILGVRASTFPTTLIDTSKGDKPEDDVELTNTEITKIPESTPESVQYVEEMSDESSWISNELGENSPVSSASILRPTKKKKKASRDDKLEKVMKMMVDELIKAQQSSDVKFLELEEKRMKLEEKALEHEERLRKKERDCQLKLWSVVMQHHSSSPLYQNPSHFDSPLDSFTPNK